MGPLQPVSGCNHPTDKQDWTTPYTFSHAEETIEIHGHSNDCELESDLLITFPTMRMFQKKKYEESEQKITTVGLFLICMRKVQTWRLHVL